MYESQYFNINFEGLRNYCYTEYIWKKINMKKLLGLARVRDGSSIIFIFALCTSNLQGPSNTHQSLKVVNVVN